MYKIIHSRVLKYIIKRILMFIPLLFLITSTVFILLSFAPGDPAVLTVGLKGTEEQFEQKREELGLNDPLYIQYWDFLKKLVLHGDLGNSYRSGRPVIDEIKRTLPVSAQLGFNALLISTILAVSLGIISAVKQYSLLDNLTKIIIIAGVSMPVFWLGLVLIVIFSVRFQLFPSAGWGNWKYTILPSITLAAYPLAILSRLTRSTMLEVIRQDYIRTARAKGLPEYLVIFRHALKNASIPIITIIGMQFAFFISGAVLTETVFAVPGLGRLTVTAIFSRDYTLIRGCILVCSAIFALLNLIVDLSYSFFDPRIRY